MKLVEILNIANKVYPDNFLSSYYNENGELIKGVNGDTLAEFIVIELKETYDVNATDIEQLRVAKRAIRRAMDELADVEHELDIAMHEIPPDSCKQKKKACCGKCHEKR